MMRIWSLFRLLGAAMLCGAAAFAIVQVPTFSLFPVAMVATEYGHWLFLIPLVLAFLPTRYTRIDCLATAFALAAAVLFLSPAIRAIPVAHRLPGELAEAFPSDPTADSVSAPISRTPLSWAKLWFAPKVEPVAVEQHTYTRHLDGALHVLLYRHRQDSPAPCVITIHGGGWTSGSATEGATLNHYLAHQGYAVAAIEYRLAPRWTWPAQSNDVFDAIDYLKQHAREFGIDPERLVLLGRSAGGQIAEAVAYGAHDHTIRGCIAFYSPADMNYAFKYAGAGDILNSLQLLRQYMGGEPTDVQAHYNGASGILLARADSPPTLLIHGRRDELVWCRQSERLADRLDSIGTPHCLVRLPWATHGFDCNFNGPGGQISTYAVETFLRAVTQ